MNEGELSGVLGLQGWPAVAEEAIIARDVLLAAPRRARGCTSATSRPRARSRSCAGPSRRAGTSPPRSPRTTCCSPTSWPAPTTRSSRSTRRCAPPTTSRRCARRSPTARSTPSPPTTPRTRSRTRTASGRRRPWGCSASRPRSRSCRRRWSRPACSTGPGSPTGCRPGRPGSGWSTTTAGRWRSGRRRTWCWSTRRRAARSTRSRWPRGRATRRTPAARCPARVVATFLRGRPTVLDGKLAVMGANAGAAGAGGRPRASAASPFGADRGDVRRGGLLHRHDRLPGDAHRPVVPPAGGRDDRAAHRQHRRQRRGPRVAPDLGGRLRRARPGPAAVDLAVPRGRSTTSSPSRAWSASAASTPARSPGTCASAARCGSASCSEDTDAASLLERVRAAPAMAGADLAGEVTTPEAVRRPGDGGAAVHGRRARPRHQGDDAACGWPSAASRCTCCRRRRPSTTCWPPARTACSSPTARATRRPPTAPVALTARLLGRRVPVFGICFGNQMLGRALGLGTYKLRYGHRGINQPVQDRRTGKVEVTAHNHGFAVDAPLDGAFDTPFGARRGQPRLPQRRRGRGAALPRRAGVLGAVPPGGRRRPARRGVPVRPVRRR